MFPKAEDVRIDVLTMCRWFVLWILLLALVVLHGCGSLSAPPSRRGLQTIRFDDARTINVEVHGGSASERIDAVRQFMAFLDNQPEVDFSSGFEQSRMTVRQQTALDDRWLVDFHLVWPSPGMDSQYFNLVKLLSWTVCLESPTSGSMIEVSASQARNRATDRLLELTKRFAQETNQVRVVLPVD